MNRMWYPPSFPTETICYRRFQQTHRGANGVTHWVRICLVFCVRACINHFLCLSAVFCGCQCMCKHFQMHCDHRFRILYEPFTAGVTVHSCNCFSKPPPHLQSTSATLVVRNVRSEHVDLTHQVQSFPTEVVSVIKDIEINILQPAGKISPKIKSPGSAPKFTI